MHQSRFRSRLAGLAAGGLLMAVGAGWGASPGFAATIDGTYSAQLTPYVSSVSGRVELTHAMSGWSGSVRLNGLTRGDTYTYEVSVAGSYVDGQAHSFGAVPVCTIVATGPYGACSGSAFSLPYSVLTPQSSAFVYSPEAHGEVAYGEYSYLADLSPYSGLSTGGRSDLAYDGTSWSGDVQVLGLDPAQTYTYAVQVVEHYSHGMPVSFHLIDLCTLSVGPEGLGACSFSGVSIEGRSDLPRGTSASVVGPVTEVAEGNLY